MLITIACDEHSPNPSNLHLMELNAVARMTQLHRQHLAETMSDLAVAVAATEDAEVTSSSSLFWLLSCRCYHWTDWPCFQG